MTSFLPESLKQPTSWKLSEHRQHRTSGHGRRCPFEPRLPTPLTRLPLVSWVRSSACWRMFFVVSRGSVPSSLRRMRSEPPLPSLPARTAQTMAQRHHTCVGCASTRTGVFGAMSFMAAQEWRECRVHVFV